MANATIPSGSGRVLLCTPSAWTERNLVHVSSRASELPLAKLAAERLCEELRPFQQARTALGLAPPPPITISQSPDREVFSAKFSMAPGDEQAAQLSRALASTLECSALGLVQEQAGTSFTFEADKLRVVLAVPTGRKRCCTLEVTGTKASLAQACWLVASAFSLAHTLSMQSDGSTGVPL
jgi:hypothetical protein